MDLARLRRNLTSDYVSKEERIAALYELERVLRSTTTVNNSTSFSSSHSHHPTTTYPFVDSTRDSMASLITGSGGVYREDKIPVGSPVSKLRKERMGRPTSERIAEKALYAAVQPRPQRQAETIARLSSARTVAPPTIPVRRNATQIARSQTNVFSTRDRDDSNVFSTRDRDDSSSFPEEAVGASGDLLAFLAAQSLDPVVSASTLDSSAFSAAEAAEKLEDLNSVDVAAAGVSSSASIEYKTWTKHVEPPVSPQHENIKGSSFQQQKRKPFTFHAERQLQAYEPLFYENKSSSFEKRTTTNAINKFSQPSQTSNFMTSRIHNLASINQEPKITLSTTSTTTAKAKKTSSAVAPFTFHRDRSFQQDENRGLLDAPLLIRANEWQEKLRPSSDSNTAFDSIAHLQSSAIDSSLKSEDFLVPKGGGIPKRYKNISSKIADQVRAMHRDRFRNKTVSGTAFDNVTIAVPSPRISVIRTQNFDKVQPSEQPNEQLRSEVSHPDNVSILNPSVSENTLEQTNLSSVFEKNNIDVQMSAAIDVPSQTKVTVLPTVQPTVQPTLFRSRASIAWTVGSDAAVEASVAADLESHRIGRNRIVADLPMMDVKIVFKGQKHTIARAEPLRAISSSSITSGATIPPTQRQQELQYSYSAAEKAASEDATTLHFTEAQQARRLIDLLAGDQAPLDYTPMEHELKQAVIVVPSALETAEMVVASVQEANAADDNHIKQLEQSLSSNAEIDVQNILTEHDGSAIPEIKESTSIDHDADSMALADVVGDD